ncbi:ABC transporter D family member 2 [Porphyridium purpureum]|uniref:Probable ATP-dependent transporter ycf16 n=1 Tax=Porphyridium purpureum TaxID=35688 RepID=A0A5J4YTR9_PORPP|nr:ABC transporter D family member 2 [Porphyridium purpureum]|eukprot:POR2015..scf229_5
MSVFAGVGGGGGGGGDAAMGVLRVHPVAWMLARAVRQHHVDVGQVVRTVGSSYLRSSKWMTTLFALGLGGLVQVSVTQIMQRESRRKAEYESRAAVSAGSTTSSSKLKKRAPAVDGIFLRRILYIFKIVVPSWHSKEFFMLIVQFWFLVVRSLISLRIAKISGDALSCIATRSWQKFYEVLSDFFVSGVAAAITNSGLKYLSNMVATCFRRNLTRHVHDLYTLDRNYYKAAVLHAMQGHLDNADQRIVADLDDFCKMFSDLYSNTFKPLLDVILCTSQMARTIGSRGPVTLYFYFVLCGGVLRAISPPFSKYIAILKALEGDFRRGHSRLITHAEEVAFLNGSAREKTLLNTAMERVTAFSEKIHLLHLRQGLFDQYGLKYMASMIGFPVMALPFLMGLEDLTPAEAVSKYKTNDALIQQACRAVGDLIMVYKKVQTLSGYTARVSELLEAIEPELQSRRPTGLIENGASSAFENAGKGALVERGEEDDVFMQFEKVTIMSPDGRLLIRELNLSISPGQNVLITGPNGAGKTSLFRVLAGLWQPSEGIVRRPRFLNPELPMQERSEIFYVPQKPYLVTGTLRDQILYPLAPTLDTDDQVRECLDRVGLTKLLTQPEGLDLAHLDWADVLSGGEKQRVGLARLYYHRPHFAILDEATSAINADEEGPFYEHLRTLGITVFSIAHRLELRRYHDFELTICGDGKGTWNLTELPLVDSRADSPSAVEQSSSLST